MTTPAIWRHLRRLRPQHLALAMGAAVLVVLGALHAQTNLDRTQQLAMERYGQRAADTIAAWRRMMDEARGLTEPEKLTMVNNFFNRRVLFRDDSVHWKQADYWATPLEFMGTGAGDCEDYSISKYMTLQMLGVSPDKLRMIYVRAKLGNEVVAHMVLGYYDTPTAEPMILDNLIGNIRPAATRTDLAPVFSFNGGGLWVAGATASSGDPTARLSRWRDVLDRMKQEGL